MNPDKKLKVAALVTARGNNTLEHKHLLLVKGKPLVWYPIEAVKNSPSIGKIYISSDDEEILRIGKEEGCGVIKRPEELSRPTLNMLMP